MWTQHLKYAGQKNYFYSQCCICMCVCVCVCVWSVCEYTIPLLCLTILNSTLTIITGKTTEAKSKGSELKLNMCICCSYLKNISFSNFVLNFVSRMLPLHTSYTGWMWLKGKKCLGIEWTPILKELDASQFFKSINSIHRHAWVGLHISHT